MKILTFDEFEKDVKKGTSFKEFDKMVYIAKWLSYDNDLDNKELEIAFLKLLYIRYIKIHKKVETDKNRIGRSSSSRFS